MYVFNFTSGNFPTGLALGLAYTCILYVQFGRICISDISFNNLFCGTNKLNGLLFCTL